MQGDNCKGWFYLFKAKKCSNVLKVSSKLAIFKTIHNDIYIYIYSTRRIGFKAKECSNVHRDARKLAVFRTIHNDIVQKNWFYL
jgi:hypothetical protein